MRDGRCANSSSKIGRTKADQQDSPIKYLYISEILYRSSGAFDLEDFATAPQRGDTDLRAVRIFFQFMTKDPTLMACIMEGLECSVCWNQGTDGGSWSRRIKIAAFALSVVWKITQVTLWSTAGLPRVYSFLELFGAVTRRIGMGSGLRRILSPRILVQVAFGALLGELKNWRIWISGKSRIPSSRSLAALQEGGVEIQHSGAQV